MRSLPVAARLHAPKVWSHVVPALVNYVAQATQRTGLRPLAVLGL